MGNRLQYSFVLGHTIVYEWWGKRFSRLKEKASLPFTISSPFHMHENIALFQRTLLFHESTGFFFCFSKVKQKSRYKVIRLINSPLLSYHSNIAISLCITQITQFTSVANVRNLENVWKWQQIHHRKTKVGHDNFSFNFYNSEQTDSTHELAK